jgi:hypothetical protein
MKDLTQGSIVSHISAMAPQIFAGMIMMMLCGLIDLYFVGGLGDAAIAGVGAAGNAGFLINALTQVLSVGTVALISHAAGRKDRADANLVFNQSLGLSAVAGVLTLIAGCLFARDYMRSVAADDAVIEAGTTYLLWFMPALALQFATLVMASALRGTGIVRPTTIVQTATVIINIVLAPVLIIGWGTGWALGVAGAGLASSIAVLIGVAMMWIYFRGYEHYVSIDRALWRPRMKQWKRILNIGLPAGGEFAIMFAYLAVIYYALRNFGAAGRIWHRFAPARRHSDAGALDGLRGRRHRRAEFWRRKPRAGEGDVQERFAAGHGRDDRFHVGRAMAAGMVARRFYQRPRDHRHRRSVPADGLAEPRGPRGDLCVLEHVSGPGEHQAGVVELRRAPGHLWAAADLAVRTCGFSHRARLVSVDCDHHAAGRADFVVAAPGAQQAAGAAAAMKQGADVTFKTSGVAGYCQTPMMHL